MVVIYNSDRMSDVISLLSSCKIVTLDIYLDSSLSQEAAEYVLQYTILSDYPEFEQKEIVHKIRQEKGYFIKVLHEVKEFNKMKKADNVKGFILSFDIRKNKLKVNKVYEKTLQTKEVCNDFISLVNQLETLINKAGKQDEKSNVYNKIPNPNGKRPRYEQTTYKEIIDILKDMEI